MSTLHPTLPASVRTNQFTARLMIVFAAFITIAGYLYIAIPNCFQLPAECFTSFAPAPFRYRVLSIWLEGILSPGGTPVHLITADIAIHTISVLVVYFGLYAWLTRWFDEQTAVIGILILLGAWMFAYWFYLRTVFTVIEMACIVLALLALNGRLAVFVALVIVASLNRETGVFLVLIWATYYADEWQTRRYRDNLLILTLTYAAVTASLHISLGSAEHVLGLVGTLERNLLQVGTGLVLNVLLLPVWLMAASGYRAAPKLLRRLAWVGGLSMISILVGGMWIEVPRLALVVYPLVLPVLLYPFSRH